MSEPRTKKRKTVGERPAVENAGVILNIAHENLKIACPYKWNESLGRSGWRSEREGGEREPPGSGEKRDPWVEGSGGERSERQRAWEEDGRPTGASYYSSNRGRGGHNSNRRGWDENDSLPEW